MISKTTILSFLLGTAGAFASHLLPDACEDTPGTVYIGEPCTVVRSWFFWTYKKCTAYTCDTISCESEYAKAVCPGTCTNCTTVVDIALSDDSFETLVGLLSQADLVSPLQKPGPYTVFAPTNDAFDNLNDTAKYEEKQWRAHLKSILLYHVLLGKVFSGDIADGAEVVTLEGSTVTASLDPLKINDAEVIAENITASNGIVHVIDEVLLPPSAVLDIVDIATDEPVADIFSTLVSLVVQVGLNDTLKSDGPFTVFAPTNAAFEKVLDVVDVTNDTEVTEVLLYHVLNGIVLAEDVTDGLEAQTVSNETLSFSTYYHDHVITINDDSTVIKADVLASNGVIHVIDEVLLPPGFERPCADSKDTSFGYSCKEIGNSFFTHFYCLFTDECPETCGLCN
mmetsp:Transcript_19698/g.27039  ORF Transcript_19698/g.27039 Transcript_19698/m.27039 type:complete len:396 (-) Transcript_19698:296-1483(-)|eukprot:CAMPEP_0185730136 /NCGR_PEP_ID=MMETSP1171-20130828/8694_1 /TAXON_ID=374046 /ORGANISM="Helicotheca tamensis, Strain CCMP826" /LENGTH=395 /DNA_ID=CAMNT_0028399131 /DNA_START=40 /DNA_END=1227 /DNA_ORIENTATION=-